MIKKHEAIAKLFSSLKIPPGHSGHLPGAVQFFSETVLAGKESSPAFKIASKKRSSDQLKAIIKHSEALAKCLDNLNQPVILGLADAGLWKVRIELQKDLHKLADVAKAIDVNSLLTSEIGGRPDNNVANAIALAAAYYYHLLTGEMPGRSVDPRTKNKAPFGPYMHLLEGLFKMLSIKANVEHAAKHALKKIKNAIT